MDVFKPLKNVSDQDLDDAIKLLKCSGDPKNVNWKIGETINRYLLLREAKRAYMKIPEMMEKEDCRVR
jgi:hypothetical protein